METNGMVAGVNVSEFLPGALVKGVKDNDTSFQGEIVAYNRDIGWLVIQQQSRAAPDKADVLVLSIPSIKEIGVVKEAACADPLPKLCVAKMRQRRQRNLQKMTEDLSRLGEGVSEDGQKLFNHIHKTLRDIAWEGEEIVVMRTVVIGPPYAMARLREMLPVSCGVNGGRQLLTHVTKVMAQYRSTNATTLTAGSVNSA